MHGWGGRPGEATVASRSRVARAAVIQLGGRAVNLAIGVAGIAILARALGTDGFGVWSTALAFVGIFGFLTNLGLAPVATQRMAAEPDSESEWLGALMGTVAIASLGAFIIAVATIPVLGDGDDGDIRLVTLILALSLLCAAPGALLAVFDSRVRPGLRIVLLTFNSLGWLAAIVFLAFTDAGIVAFALAFLGISVLTALLQWAATRRFANIALRAGRRRWKPLVRIALPIGLAGALVTVYYRIDSVLIFELKGAEEAGIYGAAYRFLDPIQFVPVSILAAVFPVMAAVYVHDPERVRRLVQRAGDYLLVVALGVLGGTVALAQPIVDLLLGPGYERSATVLPILMLAFVFISMGYLSGYLTTIVGKQWRLAAIAAGGVVANVAFNLALIPPFGAVGAAWATVVTELAVNGLALWTVFRVLKFRPSFNRAIRALLAAAIMTAAVAAAAQIDLIAGLLVAGPVYLGALLALGATTRAELRDLIGRERRLLEPSQSES
jgi:O-antigen/teichoic acid export membrane protein